MVSTVSHLHTCVHIFCQRLFLPLLRCSCGFWLCFCWCATLHLLICICWTVPASLGWSWLCPGLWYLWYAVEIGLPLLYGGFFGFCHVLLKSIIPVPMGYSIKSTIWFHWNHYCYRSSMLLHTGAVQKLRNLEFRLAASWVRVIGYHHRFDLNVHFGQFYPCHSIIPYSIYLNQEEIVCHKKTYFSSFICQK
jgi:hypothetical protein